MPKKPDKGAVAEEVLRHYFRGLGYFVVRGLLVEFDGSHVTDIDLWLYNRPSPVTRERINVDVKNKKTPQALERVFWAKGIQGAFGLDASIVATSDSRRQVVEFGRRHGVTVLDGNFLARLQEKPIQGFIGDEEFREMSRRHVGQQGRPWFERAAKCASALMAKVGYDCCNVMLPELKYFIEQSMLRGSRQEEALRYSYLLLSYFLVALDAALADSAFSVAEERRASMEEGFRFGESGRRETMRLVELAAGLALATGAKLSRPALMQSLRDYEANRPVEGLAEHFSKNQIASHLFQVARDLNDHAFRETVTTPAELVNGAKGALFAVLDFFGVERREYVERLTRTPGQGRLWPE